MSEKVLEVQSPEALSSKIKENSIVEFSTWGIFFLVLLANIIIIWVSQEFIYRDSLYYRSYSETLTKQTIEGILGFQSRFWWTAYAFTPIIFSLKFLFVSLCISIGAILSYIDIKFKDLLKTVMIAEGVFIIAQISFLAVLYTNLDVLTLQNAAGYFPLSVLNFIGLENVVSWLHYPLQNLNLFEVAYILCISWLLSKQWKPDFIESINIVLPSYGIGLIIWMALVVFLTLQIS